MSVSQIEIDRPISLNIFHNHQTPAEEIALRTIILEGNCHCVRVGRLHAILALANHLMPEPKSFEDVTEFFLLLHYKEDSRLQSICNDGVHADITPVHVAQLWWNVYQFSKGKIKE